eukprot:3738936-Amphidinium_carterae.1
MAELYLLLHRWHLCCVPLTATSNLPWAAISAQKLVVQKHSAVVLVVHGMLYCSTLVQHSIGSRLLLASFARPKAPKHVSKSELG